jgi:hypothetical protein
VLRKPQVKRECAEVSRDILAGNVEAYVDDSTDFASSSLPPLVRISALPSTIVIIFFHCDPRNGMTCHDGTAGKQRHSCTHSLTPALDRVGGQRHAPATLPQGMTRHPLCRRLGGSQGRSGRVRKISPPPGFDPRTVQPVASRCTD